MFKFLVSILTRLNVNTILKEAIAYNKKRNARASIGKLYLQAFPQVFLDKWFTVDEENELNNLFTIDDLFVVFRWC